MASFWHVFGFRVVVLAAVGFTFDVFVFPSKNAAFHSCAAAFPLQLSDLKLAL